MIRTAYLAHPLGQGEDREKNRRNAAIWGCWIAENFNRAVSADWIWLSGVWSEDKRELGIELDKVHVRRCDEIWLCGPRLSPGMQIELDEFRTAKGKTLYSVEAALHAGTPSPMVINLVQLGLELPSVMIGDLELRVSSMLKDLGVE